MHKYLHPRKLHPKNCTSNRVPNNTSVENWRRTQTGVFQTPIKHRLRFRDFKDKCGTSLNGWRRSTKKENDMHGNHQCLYIRVHSPGPRALFLAEILIRCSIFLSNAKRNSPPVSFSSRIGNIFFLLHSNWNDFCFTIAAFDFPPHSVTGLPTAAGTA